MPAQRIGPIAQAWYKWKALRLPWRKRFLVGYDLQGNTYWEFRLQRPSATSSPHDHRWRRIVHYPRSTHLSQVKVSPLWHQWLRYTRQDAPSLEEQEGDVVRQERMKYLAAEAEARWEAKPKVMEDVSPRPVLGQGQTQQTRRPPQTAAREESTEEQGQVAESQETRDTEANNPWAKAKAQGPSEKWQPTSWNPATKKR